MRNAIDEIKEELRILIKDVRERLEYEKSFGVDFFRSNLPVEKEVMVRPLSPIRERPLEDEIDELSALRTVVLECIQCPLSRTRKNVVFGVGNPRADLMFVGEAPGHFEDVKGEPFVGRAGELLTKIIGAIGLKREDVYIANILKCRPPENRNPNANEIVLCSPYLTKQIDIIKPKIICALGTFAAQTLLQTKEPIGKLRGTFHDYQGIKLIATFHPAYLLRNPNEKEKTWEDMQKVMCFLKGLKGV